MPAVPLSGVEITEGDLTTTGPLSLQRWHGMKYNISICLHENFVCIWSYFLFIIVAKRSRRLGLSQHVLKLFMDNLPNASFYEHSYMHRDVVTHIAVSKVRHHQFIIKNFIVLGWCS